ncbi:MAG: alpha/beta hydrolase, partial [Pricia sp.]
TIILVHGGGYTSGDKGDMLAYQEFLKQQLPDIAVANMNYRLADSENPPYPMQIDDLSAVVADLKDKQGEYLISEEIGFVGVSAGGHLSLLWSYAFDEDNQVNMVCSVVGPTNLLDEAYRNADDPFLEEIKNNFSDDEDFLREVSPLFQATASSPPTILFYGGQDPLVPNSHGFDLDARMTELGVPHEFNFYENEGHGWTGLNLLDTSAKLTAFIEEHL